MNHWWLITNDFACKNQKQRFPCPFNTVFINNRWSCYDVSINFIYKAFQLEFSGFDCDFSSAQRWSERLCTLVCWWCATLWRSTSQTTARLLLAIVGECVGKWSKKASVNAFVDLFLSIFVVNFVTFDMHSHLISFFCNTYHLIWIDALPARYTVAWSIIAGVFTKIYRTIWTTKACDVSLHDCKRKFCLAVIWNLRYATRVYCSTSVIWMDFMTAAV